MQNSTGEKHQPLGAKNPQDPIANPIPIYYSSHPGRHLPSLGSALPSEGDGIMMADPPQ